MRNWIRRGLALAMILGLMTGAGLAVEDFHNEAQILELPDPEGGEIAALSADTDPLIGPYNSGYLFRKGEKSPWGYEDPSITVSIGNGRIYKTNYIYARVKIATPSQIRVVTSVESLAKKTTVLGSKLAARAKAVVAVNGVLEADVTSESRYAFVDGPVLHQGVWKRPGANTSEKKLEKWKAEAGLDTLVIDQNGDLIILEADTWGEIYSRILEMGDRAVNAFSFGPALVVDGEPRYGYDRRQMSSHRPAQRMAICQTGPLEYLLISSEGPEDPDSTGLKLDQFVELIASFPDVKTAYNLDGGSSSTMVFRKGDTNWAKVNSPKNSKKRSLRDMIYFADAWIPNGKK